MTPIFPIFLKQNFTIIYFIHLTGWFLKINEKHVQLINKSYLENNQHYDKSTNCFNLVRFQIDWSLINEKNFSELFPSPKLFFLLNLEPLMDLIPSIILFGMKFICKISLFFVRFFCLEPKLMTGIP